MTRAPVVGVMGGGKAAPAVTQLAEALGAAVARRGWWLLTGGRDAGVMAAATRGAKHEGGRVVGVLPGRRGDGGEAPGLDLAIYTGMGDARNVVNVLSSDVVLALPGGAGTLSEVALAVKSGIPVALVVPDGAPAWAAELGVPCLPDVAGAVAWVDERLQAKS
ncbi:MAG: hypothetical protein ACPGQL_03110 [Thermoplasmatota archaeon]